MDAQPTYAEIVRRTINSQTAVTFRPYGNGHQRPMIHRWTTDKVHGSISLQQHWWNSIKARNAVYARLVSLGQVPALD